MRRSSITLIRHQYCMLKSAPLSSRTIFETEENSHPVCFNSQAFDNLSGRCVQAVGQGSGMYVRYSPLAPVSTTERSLPHTALYMSQRRNSYTPRVESRSSISLEHDVRHVGKFKSNSSHTSILQGHFEIYGRKEIRLALVGPQGVLRSRGVGSSPWRGGRRRF